ncbi:MAG: hypothetical protein LBJ63_02600 [Prevotellaceae bacterium]|jgi:uncharacterized protein (UPF0332 family)|nr:hypothetical protein [Prevotellaceae bacterium]
MSNLKLKSDENLKVAQILIEKGYYNSSIHCSYYGCFQFMKSILCNNIKIDYEEQDNNNGKDSHDYIFRTLKNKITNRTVEKRFRDNFVSLKSKRKKADYLNELITQDESLIARQESETVIYSLKSVFNKSN